MKLRKLTLLMSVLSLLFTLGGIAYADDRPKEGKVISIDHTAMVLSVQGDKNDTWTLYWTETTKIKGDVTVQELKVGDKINFEFMEKDGKKWVSELKRTDKAKD